MKDLKAKAKGRKTAENGFAGRLRELRRGKNLSQTELGKLVSIHYTHISRYERGLARPAADTLKRMADTLGVSGDYLLEGSSDHAIRVRIEDQDFVRQFAELEHLADDDKVVVKKVIDAFLAKKKIEAIVAR